jgi:hypothetical protein
MASIYKNRLIAVAPIGQINALNDALGNDVGYIGTTIGAGLGLSSIGPGGPQNWDWFSTIFPDSEIPIWTGLIGEFGAMEAWVWNRQGPDNSSLNDFTGFPNVHVQENDPDGVLADAGLFRVDE